MEARAKNLKRLRSQFDTFIEDPKQLTGRKTILPSGRLLFHNCSAMQGTIIKLFPFRIQNRSCLLGLEDGWIGEKEEKKTINIIEWEVKFIEKENIKTKEKQTFLYLNPYKIRPYPSFLRKLCCWDEETILALYRQDSFPESEEELASLPLAERWVLPIRKGAASLHLLSHSDYNPRSLDYVNSVLKKYTVVEVLTANPTIIVLTLEMQVLIFYGHKSHSRHSLVADYERYSCSQNTKEKGKEKKQSSIPNFPFTTLGVSIATAGDLVTVVALDNVINLFVGITFIHSFQDLSFSYISDIVFLPGVSENPSFLFKGPRPGDSIAKRSVCVYTYENKFLIKNHDLTVKFITGTETWSRADKRNFGKTLSYYHAKEKKSYFVSTQSYLSVPSNVSVWSL